MHAIAIEQLNLSHYRLDWQPHLAAHFRRALLGECNRIQPVIEVNFLTNA
jgi:hypothetical protein